MIKWLIRFFKKDPFDSEDLDAEQVMLLAVSYKFHIRNGRSWYAGGGDPELYENDYLKVGLGKIVSGYGDWGGGATHASASPVYVTVDKDLNIVGKSFEDFYNSATSREIRKRCERAIGGRLYKRLVVREDSSLDKELKKAFASEKETPLMCQYEDYKREDT